jgi:hypothetical protein
VLFVIEFDLLWVVFVTIVLINLGREGYFDVATHFSTVLAVTIAYSEEVYRWQALNVWLKDILILIHLVRIVWMISYSCRKCKLPYAIFALYNMFFGRFLALKRRCSA